MVTEKQLIANNENAKKGGPKTAEGKAIVRLNALKHGLFAADLFVPGEDTKVLREIWERLVAELKPQDTLEEMIIACIVSNFWRRQLAIRLESEYLGEQQVKVIIAQQKNDSEATSNFVSRELGNKNTWQNLVRYQTGFENRFFKAIHEFQKKRAEREGEIVAAPLAVATDISENQ